MRKTIYDERYRQVISFMKAVRKKKNITQSRVSELLGISRSIISRVETFERRMDILEAFLLGRVYGVRMIDLQEIMSREKGRCV